MTPTRWALETLRDWPWSLSAALGAVALTAYLLATVGDKVYY